MNSSFDILTMIVFGTLLPFFAYGVYKDAKRSMHDLKEHEEAKRRRMENKKTVEEPAHF